MGVPQQGVEALGVAGTQVRAVALTDGEGRFELPGGEIDRVVARFTKPFVGVVARSAGEVEIAVEREDIVRLRVELIAPAGVPLDWLDVRLTPRLAEVPPVVVLATGTTSGLHEAWWSRRVTADHVELSVLRGTWELRAERVIDGPLGAQTAPALGIDHVELDDGGPVSEQFRGWTFTVARDTTARVALRVLRPEEL